MRSVAIIRNEVPDPGVHIVRALEQAGTPFRFVTAPDGEPMPELDETLGLVVLGGAQRADDYQRHPYLLQERRLLASALERSVPVLGICLGAQILGLAAGGKLLRSPVRELGFNPVYPTAAGQADPVTSGYALGNLVFHWHEDIVTLPDEAAVLLRGEQVPEQAYRFGPCAWGVQFHPEVDRDVIDMWLAAHGDTVPAWGKSWAEVKAEADAHLAGAERSAQDMIGRFVAVLGPLPA